MRTKVMLIVVAFFLFGTSLYATELKFTTQDFAPFSYEVNGVVSGPVVDIIKEICKEMKVGYSFELLPWARAQLLVQDGSANGMFVIGYNAEREKWLYFSPPILKTEYGFFVKDDNPLDFTNTSEVKGYSVGVYGPSNTSKSLEKIKEEIKDLTIDLRPDDESGFKKLSVGRIDAVYSNRDVGYALIKKLGLKNIRYAGAHKKLKYYIGFSKKFNDKNIIDQFNNTFKELQEQGTIQGFLQKYFMEPAEAE